jgi:hypothetical protein
MLDRREEDLEVQIAWDAPGNLRLASKIPAAIQRTIMLPSRQRLDIARLLDVPALIRKMHTGGEKISPPVRTSSGDRSMSLEP